MNHSHIPGKVILILSIMILLMSFPAYSATLSHIVVTMTEQTVSKNGVEEPYALCGNGYRIEEMEWEVEMSQWVPGQTYTATLLIVPEEGNEFASNNSKGNFTVSFVNCSRISVKKAEEGVIVKLAYGPVKLKLATPDNIEWKDGVVTWDSVPGADNYLVGVYSEDGKCVAFETVTTNFCDLKKKKVSETDTLTILAVPGSDKWNMAISSEMATSMVGEVVVSCEDAEQYLNSVEKSPEAEVNQG